MHEKRIGITQNSQTVLNTLKKHLENFLKKFLFDLECFFYVSSCLLKHETQFYLKVNKIKRQLKLLVINSLKIKPNRLKGEDNSIPSITCDLKLENDGCI